MAIRSSRRTALGTGTREMFVGASAAETTLSTSVEIRSKRS